MRINAQNPRWLTSCQGDKISQKFHMLFKMREMIHSNFVTIRGTLVPTLACVWGHCRAHWPRPDPIPWSIPCPLKMCLHAWKKKIIISTKTTRSSQFQCQGQLSPDTFLLGPQKWPSQLCRPWADVFKCLVRFDQMSKPKIFCWRLHMMKTSSKSCYLRGWNQRIFNILFPIIVWKITETTILLLKIVADSFCVILLIIWSFQLWSASNMSYVLLQHHVGSQRCLQSFYALNRDCQFVSLQFNCTANGKWKMDVQ